MILQDFFKALSSHFDNKRPFVAYSKPNEPTIKAIIQTDATLNYTTEYKESGFIMAPFNNDEKAILIPLDKSENLEAEFSSSGIEVVPGRTELPTLEKELRKAKKKSHRKLIKKGVKATRNEECQKVVLSRKETLELGKISVIEVFKRLLLNYKDAFVYIWHHPDVGLWLGATPETLLTISGRQLSTMALAGTQDFIDFAHVVWGTKEKEEQQLVTDFIISKLKPIAEVLNVGKVETMQAGNLLHLETKIQATLKKDAVKLKQIINSLHPTPAICGLPREWAKQFILEREGYEREYYTGFLGELNMTTTISRNQNKRNVENSAYKAIKKTTDLYVNLRCMQIQNGFVHIYVGGGITKDSVSKYEYRETVSKAETMKKVL